MKTIKSGETTLRICATAFTTHIFKQEFKKDIFQAINEILDSGKSTNNLPNVYELYQVTWALNKTQNIAEKLPTLPFDEWLMQNNLSFMDIYQDVMEEATRGFFC